MMNQSGFPSNQMFPNQMQSHQVQPVVCPTQYRCREEFIPREVPYIHPIVNVNRQHYVDVPKHYYTETTENVMGAPISPIGGCGGQPCGGNFGPKYGGSGSGCGRRGRGRGFGRGPWM